MSGSRGIFDITPPFNATNCIMLQFNKQFPVVYSVKVFDKSTKQTNKHLMNIVQSWNRVKII